LNGTAVARRFLFVLRTKLGDTLIHFQTVRAFAARHPRDAVSLLIRRDYAPLLGGEPAVRFVFFGNRAEMVAKLLWLRVSAPPFDALAVLTGYGPAMLQIAKLVRASRRLFFDARFPDAYPEYPAAYAETNLVDRSWQTARLLDPDLPKPVRLALPALAARRAPRAADSGPIGLVPLANELRKNMDAAALAALVERVHLLHPGRPIWILLNPSDRGAEVVLGKPPPEGAEIRTFRSLADLVPFYLELGTWYGTDTGLYHLAVALGIPATVFFGPTQPRLIVMPDQPGVAAVRLAALGDAHCDEKACARPVCLHQSVAVWGGAPGAPRLDDTPAACPLRNAPADTLVADTIHENPRHQA
jgi:ADP-heptose:LPS heptosyltransferase